MTLDPGVTLRSLSLSLIEGTRRSILHTQATLYPYCWWLYGKSRQITASYSDVGVTQYISYVSYMYSTV